MILAQTSSGDGTGGFILILVIFGGFFVFMSWRQRQRMRKRQQFIDALVVGDTVRSIGGIIGVIETMDEDEAVVDSGGTRLRLARGAIAEKVAEE